MTKRRAQRPATRVTQAGRHPQRFLGAVNTPVFRASTIVFPTVADIEKVERGEYPGLVYGLHGLPTVTDLQDAVAELEGGVAAFAVPSGLTATTLPLLALTRAGDHVLVTDSVYFPTRRFCHQTLQRFGIEVEYYDPLLGAGIERHMRPNTRVVFVESPGSLTFDMQDIPAIARVAHAAGAYVVADNTWATPLGCKVLELGADVSVHAATKYIGGHSDVLLGLVVCNEATRGAMDELWSNMGVTASSDDCFLGLRGLRTLAIRMARHHASGLEIAAWLRAHPAVAEVLHPALPGARGHELWKRDFTAASGLFGVVLKPCSKTAIAAMLDGMELFAMGYSWGGFESLILPVPAGRLRGHGKFEVGGPVLRLHVGLDDPADLVADLAAGLERLAT